MVQFEDQYGRKAANSAGTFEIFLRDGTSLGGFEIQCPYDPNHDKVFIRESTIVVIQGGEVIARAFVRQLSDNDVKNDDEFSTPPPEEIRVRCYNFNFLGMQHSLSKSSFR